MFNLLFLIPQISTIGSDIMACLDGNLTEDEYNKLVDDFGNLVLSIPELSGFVAIIQSLLKVARVAFPVIESIKSATTDPSKPQASHRMMAMKAQIDSALTEDDVMRATRSLMLMIDVSKKLAESEAVDADDDAKTDFDTGTFFNNLNN